MIEEILHPSNLMRACRQVMRNKGSAGVDRMGVDQLYTYFHDHRFELETSIREKRYNPQPILGIEIPKSNGGIRLLGVPTVVDRLLQQAVGQVLCNHYDLSFEDYSYGFRPNRRAHGAVMQSLSYINSGLTWIVDIDLQSFFDEVDHCLLLQLLYRKVKCSSTLRLIRKWLRSPIQIRGKLVKRRKGVPQGSPLSPILSNILLNELDKELDRRGLKYVRYADDFSIYCAEEQASRNVGNSVYMYLRDKLHLPINRQKSGIRRPEEFSLLGFSIESVTTDKGTDYHAKVNAKRWKSLKQKIKEITRKTTPYTFDTRVRKLKEVQRGWLHYFRLARIHPWDLQRLDCWVRHRLRYCIWHHWKKPSRRCKNLIRLGVKPHIARKQSHTRMGGWAVARSPILQTTITNQRLRLRGYEEMLPLYQSIAPHLNEPLYTRPVRTVV